MHIHVEKKGMDCMQFEFSTAARIVLCGRPGCDGA